MILTNIVLASLASLASVGPVRPGGEATVKFTLPEFHLAGAALPAQVEILAPKEGAKLAGWMFAAAAFTLDGEPLGTRHGGDVELAPGQKLTIEIDLGPLVASSGARGAKSFKLGYPDGRGGVIEKEITAMQTAEKGLDFMSMPVEDLSSYRVFLQTNRGNMEIEFWPDVAPLHVRNFLDLCYTGFYDGKTFHRVIPGFMIQGGDPRGDGTGNGPRMLKAEFNNKKHVAGVLSMARSNDPNSASCQFFIMHAAYPSLDGQYSAFGKLVSGQEVVDKIATARKNTADKPFEPQQIVKASVIRAGGG